MNDNLQTDVKAAPTSDVMGDEIEQRLAQIAAAMTAKLAEGTAKKDLPEGLACPIDPAERALCEGCQ
jgi:hypothetical protein